MWLSSKIEGMYFRQKQGKDHQIVDINWVCKLYSLLIENLEYFDTYVRYWRRRKNRETNIDENGEKQV